MENEREVARDGLSVMRNQLRSALAKFAKAEKKLEKVTGHSDIEKWAAKRQKASQDIDRLRAVIQERESVIYGTWAPKEPPTPERSQQIRKQVGQED